MAKIDVHDHETGYKICFFWCPGCEEDHGFTVNNPYGGPTWAWNGDVDNPTFSPSLLCNPNYEPRRCHLYVREGKIQYLSDCWHELKGQTVDMQDVES